MRPSFYTKPARTRLVPWPRTAMRIRPGEIHAARCPALSPWRLTLRRPPAEPEGNDDHGRPDEQGDGVGDHQCHDPGRRSVGDPQQESDEQNREIADGYLTGGLLAQHAADLQYRCDAHQHRPRRCNSGEDGFSHGAPAVRRPGGRDRARQLPGEGRKHDRCHAIAGTGRLVRPVQAAAVAACRRLARARSASTATVAASRAAATAIRVICQPAMPPVTTVWTAGWTGTPPGTGYPPVSCQGDRAGW